MNVTVPLGVNAATVQVLDANGSDITAGCTITAVSSDPSVIQIGNPNAANPNIIPFTALKEGSTATIDYTATNSAGEVSQTDSVTVTVTAPASMVIVYTTTVPVKVVKK
jgi:hypothetical protein